MRFRVICSSTWDTDNLIDEEKVTKFLEIFGGEMTNENW